MKSSFRHRKSPAVLTAPAADASFLEMAQSVTLTNVTNALVFDTLFVSEYSKDTDINSDLITYCDRTLKYYFLKSTFPKTGTTDNQGDREYYTTAAMGFYQDTVATTLNC